MISSDDEPEEEFQEFNHTDNLFEMPLKVIMFSPSLRLRKKLYYIGKVLSNKN